MPSFSKSGSGGGGGWKGVISAILSFILVGVIIAGFVFFGPDRVRDPACKFVQANFHLNTFCNGIISVQSVQVEQDTMYVGMSDGNFPFDVHDPNGNGQYKQQAADDFNAGNIDGAISNWQNAINLTTDDAESMIYIEDARVTASQQPYVTIVVATTMSRTFNDIGASIAVASDDLRGVYLAQKNFNEQHPNLKVRILVANLGVLAQDHLSQAETVVLHQIVRLAHTDDSFIGVIGFPFSAAAKMAIPVLEAEHIPIISPSASSSALHSPYFFRMVPSDNEQGRYAVQFASEVLGVHMVAIFSDSHNSYSQSLANGFTTSFRSLGSDYISIPESFTLGSADSLDAPLNDALAKHVDMIFLAGYGADVNNLKSKLAQQGSNITVMGGDASYELGAYDAQNYHNFYFTAFTYPDTWGIVCYQRPACAALQPTVTNDKHYKGTFDPKGQYTGQYGYARTGPHVLLSYDATTALLMAANVIRPSLNKGITTRQMIRDAIQRVSFQGSSGQISFTGSNPSNKAVLILCIDSNHHTQLVSVYGQFVPGVPDYRASPQEIRNILCK